MKIFPVVGDESVDNPVFPALPELGYPVYAIVHERPGIEDEEVLEITWQKEALLITCDKDFGSLVVRERRQCLGVVLHSRPKKWLSEFRKCLPLMVTSCWGLLR